jgi:hypothetical protein
VAPGTGCARLKHGNSSKTPRFFLCGTALFLSLQEISDRIFKRPDFCVMLLVKFETYAKLTLPQKAWERPREGKARPRPHWRKRMRIPLIQRENLF